MDAKYAYTKRNHSSCSEPHHACFTANKNTDITGDKRGFRLKEHMQNCTHARTHAHTHGHTHARTDGAKLRHTPWNGISGTNGTGGVVARSLTDRLGCLFSPREALLDSWR